jgi:hypothetical protein
LELKRRYVTEREELQAKEDEVRRKRELLANLEAVIKGLEERGTESSGEEVDS